MSKVSRELSYLLRHNPGELSKVVLPNGTYPLTAVVEHLKSGEGFKSYREKVAVIEGIVAKDEKGRFSLGVYDGVRTICANYGHSSGVVCPTVEEYTGAEMLYHATPSKNVDSIMVHGLKPMNRGAVHLTPSVELAIKNASRFRGSNSVTVLSVAPAELRKNGLTVYASNPLVFTVERVPAELISVLEVVTVNN